MAIANSDGSIILSTKVDTSGMEQGTKSIKSQAAKLAAEYRKAGMSQSEAFKKAWSEIDRTKKSTDKATKSTKEYGEQAQKSGGTAKSAFSSVGVAFKKLAVAAAAAFSVQKIIQFGAEASNLATTSEASVQRLIDIYGEASQAVGGFIDTNAQALGMSRSAAVSYSSIYGNLFSVWADQSTNAALTARYLNMTAVVASKTGRTVEDVQERIRSGLLGNTEAIEDLGVFVNVKTIEMTDAFQRMANGKSWQQLDAYTQQQIRTFAILEQATKKYGDEVARTSALTKSQFQAAWQDFQATWGQVVNRVLIPVLDVLTEILITSTAVMRSIFNISSATISQSNATADATKNQEKLTEEIKETEKAAKKAFASFDTIQILSSGDSQESSQTTPIIPEITLPVGDLSGQSSALEENLRATFERISQIIQKAWDSEPVQSFWGAVKSAGENGLLGFETIGSSIKGRLETTWGDIEADLSMATTNMIGLWTTFWQDVQVGIDTWGQPIIDGVNGVFNSMWTTAIDPYIQLMVGAWSDFTGILKSKWEEYGQPLIDDIGQFATNAIGAFQSIYDNVLEPIITPFLQEMTSLWDNHFSKTVGKAFDFVSSLAALTLMIYNKFIFPIVSWLSKKLKPAFSNIGKAASSIFGTVGKTISGVLGGIFDSLDGILEFITGVFKGDWEKAWNGISQYFKGVWEGFVSLIKGVLNIIIDALNVMINGMNLISFDMPNWDWLPNNVQGKSFGINIPNIPKLAQGTVVPPNKEFMAVLGDNKKEHEIVSPVSTMKQAFMEAMIEMGGNFGGGNTEVVLEIDGREFGRAVVEQGNRENRRIGTRLVIA